MKSLMILAAGSLMFAPAFVTPAIAGSNPNADLGAVAFCKVDQPANAPNLPFGNCIDIVGHSDHGNYGGLVPGVCQWLEATDPADFDAAYGSIADCVHDGASIFFG